MNFKRLNEKQNKVINKINDIQNEINKLFKLLSQGKNPPATQAELNQFAGYIERAYNSLIDAKLKAVMAFDYTTGQEYQYLINLYRGCDKELDYLMSNKYNYDKEYYDERLNDITTEMKELQERIKEL